MVRRRKRGRLKRRQEDYKGGYGGSGSDGGGTGSNKMRKRIHTGDPS